MSEQIEIIESTQQGTVGTVEFQVKEFGRWTLGYQWVDVTLGGASTTGLALYAKKNGREAAKYVSFNLKSAIGFFADNHAPAKSVAKVLRAAEAHGSFDGKPLVSTQEAQ